MSFSYVSLLYNNKVYSCFYCSFACGTQYFVLFGGKSTTKTANKKKKTLINFKTLTNIPGIKGLRGSLKALNRQYTTCILLVQSLCIS